MTYTSWFVRFFIIPELPTMSGTCVLVMWRENRPICGQLCRNVNIATIICMTAKSATAATMSGISQRGRFQGGGEIIGSGDGGTSEGDWELGGGWLSGRWFISSVPLFRNRYRSREGACYAALQLTCAARIFRVRLPCCG